MCVCIWSGVLDLCALELGRVFFVYIRCILLFRSSKKKKRKFFSFSPRANGSDLGVLSNGRFWFLQFNTVTHRVLSSSVSSASLRRFFSIFFSDFFNVFLHRLSSTSNRMVSWLFGVPFGIPVLAVLRTRERRHLNASDVKFIEI